MTTKAGERLLTQTLGLRIEPESIAAIEAEAVAAYKAELRAKVDGLPIHTVSGYEWECDCGKYDDSCPHFSVFGEAVDCAAVLALIDEAKP